MEYRPMMARPWTCEEDALLAELAGHTTAAELAGKLARSRAAVFHRLGHLGISKKRRWTAQDDRKLWLLWGNDMDMVARELGRTRATVYWRAQVLGLNLGCPEGMERITAAAKRSGFAVSQLRQVLHHSRAKVYRTLTRKPAKRSRMVDPMAVDRAVERWQARTHGASFAKAQAAGFKATDEAAKKTIDGA
jgi:hypothetical protein